MAAYAPRLTNSRATRSRIIQVQGDDMGALLRFKQEISQFVVTDRQLAVVISAEDHPIMQAVGFVDDVSSSGNRRVKILNQPRNLVRADAGNVDRLPGLRAKRAFQLAEWLSSRELQPVALSDVYRSDHARFFILEIVFLFNAPRRAFHEQDVSGPGRRDRGVI